MENIKACDIVEYIGNELHSKASVIEIDKVEELKIVELDFNGNYEFSMETLRICSEAPLNKVVNSMKWRERYKTNK